MFVFILIFCSQQQGPLRSENARFAILNNTIRAAKSSRNHELKLLTLICVDHGRGTSSLQGWRDKFKSGLGKAKGQLISKQNCGAVTSPKKQTKRTQDSILSTFCSKKSQKLVNAVCERPLKKPKISWFLPKSLKWIESKQ